MKERIENVIRDFGLYDELIGRTTGAHQAVLVIARDYHHENLIMLLEDLTTEQEEYDVQALAEFLSEYEPIIDAREYFNLLLRFIADEKYATVGYLEKVLRSERMEKYLLQKKGNAKIQKLFKEIMTNKIRVSCDSLAFSYNYRIFLDWMPKWKSVYPYVWEAIADNLVDMRNVGKLNYRCYEKQKLYDLYNQG